MKQRYLFNELTRYIDHKNALVITGMRQVGKTTLLRQVYNTVSGAKLWFDLDNPLDVMHFEDKDYNGIFDRMCRSAGTTNQRLYIFIDEIQNYPEITKIIKFLIDHYNVKFLVTGSSNFYLKNLFPESLSGRKFLFNLPPLRFSEYLWFNDIANHEFQETLNPSELLNKKIIDYKKYVNYYEDYLEFGGFPEVLTTEDHDTKRLILKNIIGSFFEKDITLLSDLKSVRELRDLILLLVPRTGNMIDVTKLSQELEINRVRIYNYLELLQGTFFINLIPKYSKSIDRSIAGGKKLYFTDTGILNYLGRVNDGQLFETAIANQLSNYGPLSFYNKRNRSEIDFILNKEIAFEVKNRSTEHDMKKLNKICESLDIKKRFIISRRYSDARNTIYPFYF